MDQLWAQIAGDFERFGWWQRGQGLAARRQAGVLRTNCIDCLDRTNVVQGYIARHHLEAVLRALTVLPPGGSLPGDLPSVRALAPPARPLCQAPSWPGLPMNLGTVIRGFVCMLSVSRMCLTRDPHAPLQGAFSKRRCSHLQVVSIQC